jgi:hypothetical protein
MERALIERNNTNEMLPENNTGKDDEAVERTQNTPIAKRGEEPDDHGKTTTEALECIGTDKLVPSIGSIRKTQQGRNMTVDTKPALMNSSTSKLNTQRAQNGFGCPCESRNSRARAPPSVAPPSSAPGVCGGFGVLLYIVFGAEEMGFGLSEISNVEIRF